MKSLGFLILGLSFTWYGILHLPTNIQGSTISLIIGLLMIGYFTKNQINKVDNNYKNCYNKNMKGVRKYERRSN